MGSTESTKGSAEAREKAPGQLLIRQTVSVEIEGEEKPALTAQWLGLIFT